MASNKKIAFLGKLDNIKIDNVDFISFENINTALMDYDILILHPNLFYKLTHKNYSYEDYRSGNLKWLKKISDFLFSKKNIFIFATEPILLSSRPSLYSNYTNYIYTSDIFETILHFMNKKEESGKVILKKANSILDNFYNRFEKLLEYHIFYEKVIFNDTLFKDTQPIRVTINSQPIDIPLDKNKINSQSIDIFTGKDTNKILSSIIKIENIGNILLLPQVVFEKNEEFEKDFNDLLNIIVEIDKNLKNINNPKPQWLESNENYSINVSENIKSELANIDEKINKLNEKKTELNKNLEKEEQIKDLLFENGKLLENAIIEALRILDYEAENRYIGNNEIDILAKSPERDIFCCEAEGKDNSPIDITKFRQLSDNLNIYRDNYPDDTTYAILFGNPYRLKDIEERIEEPFTKHCLNRAKDNNIILVKTTDLFFVIRDIKNYNDNDNEKIEEYKKKCREAILNSKGNIVIFPKIEIS